MSVSVEVNYWAEGPTDRAAARKLIQLAGGAPGADYSQRRGAAPGKDYLDSRLRAFNAAAKFAPWVVLRDGDGECAKELSSRLLCQPSPGMQLRIVVPTMEAWLVADREAFAAFLGLRANELPERPELHAGLKELLVRTARNSRRRDIRIDFAPTSGSGRQEGPGYAQQLIEFINSTWSPARAAPSAPSLQRAVQRLTELVKFYSSR